MEGEDEPVPSGQGGGASPLVKLQSRDHEEILNVIDQLRSEGISEHINLPQLIVCGDQSSGKSSVLEAISGLGFPQSDNICTRFATELILRRSSQSGVTASIYPDKDRPADEKERLRGFRSPNLALDNFARIVRSAEEFMGIDKAGLSFSKDTLRVEVSGRSQPDLTLVDLPGLYHAPDESQGEEGVAFVEDLVLSYMRNRRCVMLAVISAKSDIALQKVTAFTRKIDPKGERTMGIITKPDTLHKDSDMEQSFYNLARNKRVTFRLGWHVLKNRDFGERHDSITQRDKSESRFLSQGIWSSLPRYQAGIDTLRPRLSTILKAHILSEIPSLIAETQSAFKDAESSLQKLGHARQTLSEQRRYLLQSSERFAVLIRSAIHGIYFDPFFGDAINDKDYEKRLRAVVQNRLSDFSDTMRERGEYREITQDDSFAGQDDSSVEYDPSGVDGDDFVTHSQARCISRSDFVGEVKERMRRSRGRELPGTFNPLIIGDLFYLQSRPWKEIVNEYIDLLLEDVRKAVMPMLQDVLDQRSIEGLLKHVVNPYLTQLEDGLRAKTAELLKPQQTGHPITYNHYFIDAVQKAREQHSRDSITKKLEAYLNEDAKKNSTTRYQYTFSMASLIDALSPQTDNDMDHFACSEAIDCMLAFYKVARKKFVDDFSNLAVEKCLLEPLLTMYCSRTVGDMGDDFVSDIASEDESTAAERGLLQEKSAVLGQSLDQLRRLDRHVLADT